MTVVGVLTSVGSSSSSSTTTNQDDQALVPITTAAQRIFGGTSRNSVSSIIVQARSSADLTAAYQEADHELLAAHDITTAADADFTITSEQIGPFHRHLGRQDADHPAGGHRRNLASRRWHRRHEHHAGLGHRTGAGDRVAQGARGDTSAHPTPIPRGGVGARTGRRGTRCRARDHRSRVLAGCGGRPHHDQCLGGRVWRSSSPWRSGSCSACIRPVGRPTWPP